MGQIVRVVRLARCLVFTIPKGYCRELGILKGSYVEVRRIGDRGLLISPVEVHDDAALRRAGRPAPAR